MKKSPVTAIAAAALFCSAHLATAATVPVTPAQPQGWVTKTQATATGTFVDDNGPAGFGPGSYRQTTGLGTGVGPGNGGKVWLANTAQEGTKLADITALSYQTYVSPSSTALSGANVLAPAIQLMIDLNGDGTRDTTMVYEPVYSPAQGTVTKGIWQSWDAKAGNWWFTRDTLFGGSQAAFPSLSEIIAAYPNAQIVRWGTAASTNPDSFGTQIVGGQNSAGAPWQGFDGNIDAFTFSTANSSTTYDFGNPDEAAPVISGLSATPSKIGPPNNKLVDVALTYTVTDDRDSSPTVTISVASGQPNSDPLSADDFQIVDNNTLKLRASKAPRGNERTYVITVIAKDAAGNTTSKSVIVTVPKNSGGKS